MQSGAIRTSPRLSGEFVEAEKERPRSCPALDHSVVSPGERRPRAWEKDQALGAAPSIGEWARCRRLPINLDESQVRRRGGHYRKKFCHHRRAGTGKTTLLMSLLAILRRAKVTSLSPRRLAGGQTDDREYAKMPHTAPLLEYIRVKAASRNPISRCKWTSSLVDEASGRHCVMDHLLAAIEPHTHLILSAMSTS